VRTDKNLRNGSVQRSSEWQRDVIAGEEDPEIDMRLHKGDELVDGKLVVHSLSGKERNHLFLNEGAGRTFTDLSALSGMDSVSDSRCFALFDYDHDGWQDVAMVNANQPLMQLYQNDIGKLPGMAGGMVAIRFVGGNTTPAPSEFGNRDGYGAMVEVVLSGGVKLKREHRCGEGYAAQNSSTMIIGIGDRDAVESVSVRWPSGKTFSVEGVVEGTLLTAHENRADGGAFSQTQYRNARERIERQPVKPRFPVSQGGGDAKVQVYTTTATWCVACISHLPELRHLAEDGVALFGVPIDENDDAGKLAAYVEKHQPAYTMLAEMGVAEKNAVTEFFARAMQVQNPVLPSSVITDGEGNVLEVVRGIPTLSQVRKWRRP
jgi:thiol-disulfide isomerase/thioredoxin